VVISLGAILLSEAFVKRVQKTLGAK